MRRHKKFPRNFWGNNEDYGYPYRHRYDEPDSDRGASDEHHDEEEKLWRK